LPYLSIRKPNAEPRIKVIIVIGISENGSCQPIMMAEGNNTRNGIMMPLATLFIFRLLVAIKKPEIIQREKADRFASHVNFCRTIGITSITPAIIPSKIPSWVFFMFIIITLIYLNLNNFL